MSSHWTDDSAPTMSVVNCDLNEMRESFVCRFVVHWMSQFSLLENFSFSSYFSSVAEIYLMIFFFVVSNVWGWEKSFVFLPRLSFVSCLRFNWFSFLVSSRKRCLQFHRRLLLRFQVSFFSISVLVDAAKTSKWKIFSLETQWEKKKVKMFSVMISNGRGPFRSSTNTSFFMSSSSSWLRKFFRRKKIWNSIVFAVCWPFMNRKHGKWKKKSTKRLFLIIIFWILNLFANSFNWINQSEHSLRSEGNLMKNEFFDILRYKKFWV